MYDGHANAYALKFKGRSLTLTTYHHPNLSKLKWGSEKSLYMSETWVERAIS